MRATVIADLHVDMSVDGGRDIHAHLIGGHGGQLQLEVDDPAAFAGRGDAAAVRLLAETMASLGQVVHVVHRDQHLVSIGAVRAPWWQRRLTGSKRIRLGSWRGALTAARARAGGADSVLPDVSLVPPGTLWPPAPTFGGRRRRSASTTHDPARGGAAHLVISKENVWGGERQPLFWLDAETTVGSDAACDIVLNGLEPLHAVVRHDDADEYVVQSVAGVTRVHGEPANGQLLRTGSRIDVGAHHLVFHRDEYADHGRPHGGRLGGEFGRQRPQPPRPNSAGTGEWSDGGDSSTPRS